MKRLLLCLPVIFMVTAVLAQNKLVLKNAHDSASIVLTDSSLYLNVDGKTSLVMPENKTIYLTGSARAWDDLRVPVTSTNASGSNPPQFAFFKNNGGSFVGKARKYDGVIDYDSLPAVKNLFFSQGGFAVAFWMIPEPGMSPDAKILYKKGSWNIAIQNNKIRVYLEGHEVFLSSTELNLGTRNLVVMNVQVNAQNINLRLLINNQIAGNVVLDGSWTDVSAPLLIGRADIRSNGSNYKGTLDQLMFWKKNLNTAETDSLWNRGRGTESLIGSSALTAVFNFNEIGLPYSKIGGVEIKSYLPDAACAAEVVPGLISLSDVSHGVFAYYFDSHIIQELFFTAQLPHTWAEGTQIEPHIHYFRPDSDTGTVVWGLEFSWCNMGETFPDTRVVYSNDSKAAVSPGTQVYSSFGMIDGSGKRISSMLVCRVFRAADDPRDTYPHEVGLLEIDFHILNSSLGSSGILK